MADGKATERKPRETETRADSEREKPWEPPQVLPDPTPEEGYAFRWIRTGILGADDNVNVSKRFREGWEPVLAEDHPELMLVSDRNSTFKGNVEIGGDIKTGPTLKHHFFNDVIVCNDRVRYNGIER